MAISCKVGTFAIDSTKTATQTQEVTGVGFQGKVGIFWYGGTTSATDATAGGTARFGFGTAVSSSEQGCIGAMDIDAAGNSDAQSEHRTDSCIVILNALNTLDGRAAFTSWGADGFILTIGDQFTANYIVSYMILGGTDLTAYKTGVATSSGSVGADEESPLAFQPDFLLLYTTAGAVNTITANAIFNLGFGKASGSGNQYIGRIYSDNAANTMSTVRYMFDAEILTLMLTNRAALASLDSDGWTLNWLEVSGTIDYHYLALKGGQYTVGDLLTQTDTTTTITETVPETFRGVMMMSHNTVKSTQDTAQNHNSFSLGAANSTTSRVAQGWWSENATADAETATSIEYDGIYTRIAADDTLVGVGDISAADATSFTFKMDDADPDQAFVAWWAVSDAAIVTAVSSIFDSAIFGDNILGADIVR